MTDVLDLPIAHPVFPPIPALQDIASGMAFLHANSVLHMDMSGGNVLLNAAPDDPRTFVAKASAGQWAGRL